MADGGVVLNSRVLAAFVGLVSLVLGVFTVVADEAAIGLAAGALGLVAGLLALLPEPTGRRTHDRRARPPGGPSTEGDPGMFPTPDPVIIDEVTTTPADAELLTDPGTGLFSEAYLRVALDSRLAAARRHLRPVAVAILEVTEGMAEDPQPAPPDRIAEAIRETVREADIACRMDDGPFAVILEDTPENGAVWTVERIRRNLVSRFGHHTLWAGVACYPAHAFDTAELLSASATALAAAKEWKQDRIEVAATD